MNINLSTNVSNEDRSRIIDAVKRLAANYDVKIIHCVEAGSRSWGIQSSDSDFDVRFIFAHNDVRKYVGMTLAMEEIVEKSDDLDIHGYDIKAVYKFIANGEVNVYEWLSSDIVYMTSYEDMWVIEEIAHKYFDVGTICRCYYGFAKRIYINDLKWVDNVKVKKYLYALRAILCSRYVIANKEPVPLRFDKLVEYMSYDYQDELEKLLTIKTDMLENYQASRSYVLEEKMLDELSRLEELMRPIQKRVIVDYTAMNDALLRYVLNHLPEEYC